MTGLNWKKITVISATFLMLLSTGVSSVSASQTSNKNTTRTAKVVSVKNQPKLNRLQRTQTKNVVRYRRIQRHLVSHQKNLAKIQKELKHFRFHKRNAALYQWLKRDKGRLIHAIEYNQRGLLLLAKRVVAEIHAINRLRHPHTTKVVKPTVVTNPNLDQRVIPKVVPESNDNSAMSENSYNADYYSNDNGQVNQGFVKLSLNNGQFSGDLNWNGVNYPLNAHTFNAWNANLSNAEAQMRSLNQQYASFDQQVKADLKQSASNLFNF